LPNRIFASWKTVRADLHRLVESDDNLVTDRSLCKGRVAKNEAESRRQKESFVLHILLLKGARF
jgi:hypothetical protein